MWPWFKDMCVFCGAYSVSSYVPRYTFSLLTRKSHMAVSQLGMRRIVVEIPEHLAEELEKIHGKKVVQRLKEIILDDFSGKQDS